ncbi:MAG: calcium-binding protein [Mesorhizobium sp.]
MSAVVCDFVRKPRVTFTNPMEPKSMATSALAAPTTQQGMAAGPTFFVLGVFAQPNSMMSTWRDRGVNTLFENPEGSNVDQWSAAAAQSGLFMIRQPSNNLQSDLYNPYLLAWTQPDEPSNTSTTLDYGQVAYDPAEIAQIAAPWRAAAAAANEFVPVIGSHVGTHIFPTWADNSAIMHDYMQGPESDWLAADSYPIQFGRSMLYDAGDYTSTEMGISAYKQIAWSGGKSAMTFIASASTFSGQPVPTAAQFKAQAWSAIINGSEGIIYFTFGLSPTFDWDATPASLVTAIKELNSEIASIDTILMNEATGGRDPYTVFHASNPGVAPKAGQLPFPFEATEIITAQGAYRIILNLSDQPQVLNKPEWNLNNVTFAGYEVKRGYLGESNGPGNSDPLTGDSGDNTLVGTAGADTMRGMAGNDTYVVDNAGDVVDEANGSGTDTVKSSISFSLANSSKVVGSLENLTLTGSGNINATGNALANVLTGNSGNNTLDGGAGADTMRGMAGNDTYVVDNAGDVVDEANGSGTDTVKSSISFSLTNSSKVVGSLENLTLTGSGNINATGNALANVLTGNSGNNTLDGGAGADIMSGGAGNDTYYVDNAGDKVVESNVAGTDLVNSSVSFTLGQYVEKLALTGSGNINGTGNSLNNTLAGNSGANILNGIAGNDTIRGDAGNDKIYGGLGNDILTGGAGNDSFVFNTALNTKTNVDRITDFNVVNDTLVLENAIFTKLGTTTGTLSSAMFWKSTSGLAHDSSDRIIYETDTGKLFYDSNGNAAGGSVHFATLAPGLALTNADFLII